MEELTEVITAAEFHPQSCNYLMYSSSKVCSCFTSNPQPSSSSFSRELLNWETSEKPLCAINIPKVRLSNVHFLKSSKSHFHSHAEFEEEEDPANKSFFSEIIASISDIKFSRDGRYILSRDYLTLKEWDLRMENRYLVIFMTSSFRPILTLCLIRPVRTIRIHDFLKSKLCDLYENDCIFDKFECSLSGTGEYALAPPMEPIFKCSPISSAQPSPHGFVSQLLPYLRYPNSSNQCPAHEAWAWAIEEVQYGSQCR